MSTATPIAIFLMAASIVGAAALGLVLKKECKSFNSFEKKAKNIEIALWVFIGVAVLLSVLYFVFRPKTAIVAE